MAAPYKLLIQTEPSRAAAPNLPAASPVYRNVWVKDGMPNLEKGVDTCYDIFNRSARLFATKPCLGWRPKQGTGAGDYQFLTYQEVEERVAAIAAAIIAQGVATGSRVGMYGSNSPEWMMTMQACNRQSFASVPIYDSLGDNAVEYILRHAEISFCGCAVEKLVHLIKAASKLPGQLKGVVYWGGALSADIQEKATAAGLTLHNWNDFLEIGRKAPTKPIPPKASDICTIMYTSGTTGDPKGVMTKHSAVVATVCGLTNWTQNIGLPLTSSDSFLSYLPLAHIFDRVAEETFLYHGMSIGYWQGEVTKLIPDAQALHPTVFLGVPRVFDRVYSTVAGQLKKKGWLGNFLFNWAYGSKVKRMKSGVPQNRAAPFWDWLVFGKMKNALGGQVRCIVSGGAPISSRVEEFLKVTMCCLVAQGYGLTETCAASFMQLPDEFAQLGTCGPPQPLCEFKLESINEMDYDALANPPFGEVLVRGPQTFAGYYKMETATKEVLDADGWFHTGDIATITPEGALKIVDRKKNIFKLAHGEYIAVEKLENVYKINQLVDQVWVYGNSFKSSLLAVVVPNERNLRDAVRSTVADADQLSLSSLCANSAVQDFVTKSLQDHGRAQKLKGFEILKLVLLEPNPFTLEDDLLTPTFKLKRAPLLKKYQAAIDEMYKKCGE